MTEMIMDELLKQEPYSYEMTEKKAGGLFYNALLEELCFHYDQNEKYRKFCEHKEFNPHNYHGELENIPMVHVSVFKELGRTLSSVSSEQIKFTLQSSATSGVPSSVPVDKITSKRQARAMVRIISEFIGNERKPFLVMDADPALGFREMLSARIAAVSGYLNFASSVGYFLKINTNREYYFDIDGIRNFIDSMNADQPAVVFGFTYILYSEVIKPLEKSGVRFSLPLGSKVIHIGGWKKLEQEKISKEDFNQKTAELFGIMPDNVIDIYGFTEQMGLNYPDCRCGCKHASLYSEVIVRDVTTKQVLPPGTPGQLEFLSPVPHSYPGNVVLTDDIGVIEAGDCPYMRGGVRFRVLGRLKKAEVRGCGDILAEKLKFAGNRKTESANNDKKLRIDFAVGFDDICRMSPEDALYKISDNLKVQLSWIRRQPVDALIGLIAQVARKWSDPDWQMVYLKERSGSDVNFLSAWCKPEHLNVLLSEGLHENRLYLDTFQPSSESGIQYKKAVSRGLVCHWLAGNVQTLGMYVLIESILTKNVNLLRVSSRDNGIFTSLLNAFAGETYSTPGGFSISGDDLLKTIAVIYYDHANMNLSKIMSEAADVRVAWGGKDAVTAVINLASKYDCEDVIMGPKLSFAAVGRETIQDLRALKKLTRKIAVDASVFDQTGCASAHNIFVERGGCVSPEQFAEYLAEGMKKVSVQIPKAPMTVEQIAAIHSIRGVYDFKGFVYGDADAAWTVLYSDDVELSNPVYSRVVFVHPVNEIMDTLPFIDENTQTIGLSATGDKAIQYAMAASEKGAVRFPVCGRMLNFDSPWDGMYLTDKFVKWVTLGGPLV